jgi:nitrogen regulatory protein PII-like uncharacterized protein
MTINKFINKYKHITEDLGDCYFHKIVINDRRINIQEDKDGENHFYSIHDEEGNAVFAGYVCSDDNVEKIFSDILTY